MLGEGGRGVTSYAIRGGEEGARRLELLAQIMAPTTDALPALAGMRPGMRCLDLGWREPATYDLAYGRFIISHLADRPAILASVYEALLPGGTLVLEDIDFSGAFCWPASDGYATYCRLYEAVIRHRGGDANAGGQLYGLCVGAGFSDIGVQVVQPSHCGRCDAKGLSLSILVNIADAVLAEGLATADELDQRSRICARSPTIPTR